jgi:hypothetical protein
MWACNSTGWSNIHGFCHQAFTDFWWLMNLLECWLLNFIFFQRRLRKFLCNAPLKYYETHKMRFLHILTTDLRHSLTTLFFLTAIRLPDCGRVTCPLTHKATATDAPTSIQLLLFWIAWGHTVLRKLEYIQLTRVLLWMISLSYYTVTTDHHNNFDKYPYTWDRGSYFKPLWT